MVATNTALRSDRIPGGEPTQMTVTDPLVTNSSSPVDIEPLSFSELAVQISTGGLKRRVHPSTIHRWRSRGIRKCRLEAFRIGGRWFTTELYYARFCAAVTATTTDGTSNQAPARADKRVTTALAREGF